MNVAENRAIGEFADAVAKLGLDWVLISKLPLLSPVAGEVQVVDAMPPDDASARLGASAPLYAEPRPSAPVGVIEPTRAAVAGVLKILILADEPNDAELIQRALRKAGLAFTATCVGTRHAFIETLETFAPDIVLADYKLSDFNGADALTHVRHVHPEIPVVMVAGALAEASAIELLHAGAKDYVLKSNLVRLPLAIVRAIAVEQGIRARKAVELARQQSELRYRTLVAATTQIVWITNGQGRVVEDLPAWRAFTGQGVPQVLDDGWTDAVHPDDCGATVEAWRRAQQTGTPYHSEFRLRRGDGVYRTMSVRSVPVREADGSIREWIGTCTDITEARQAERKIREEEAKFRSLVEQNVAGVAIIRQDGTIGYVNPYFAGVLGRKQAETIGRPLVDFVSEREQAIVAEKLRATLTPGKGDLAQFETEMKRPGGNIVDILINASPVIFEGELAAIGVAIDITERKRAERELAFNAAVLATEHEVSLDGILVVDPQDQIISFNQRFVDMWELSPELVASRSDARAMQSVLGRLRDPEYLVTSVKRLLDHPEEKLHDELALVDGRTFERYSAAMPKPGGDYFGRVFFFRDITERKQAEETLRTSEERFRLVVEEAPDAILLYDVDEDRLISANKAAEQLFGRPRDKIIEHGPQQFYVPEPPDARPVAQSFGDHNKRALAGETLSYERRIRNASGQERLCQVTLVRMPSPGRQLLRASFVDITDHKEAERTLLRLNRTLRTLSRGNEVLVHATSEPELLRETCQTIVETGGYRMAWIGIAEHDADKAVIPAASAGDVRDYLGKAQISWADEPCGRGPTGCAIRSGEVQVVQNFATDPRAAPWRAEAREHGFSSSIALPLKDKSGIFGSLTIYSEEVGAFDADELKLLQELANDLAFGIRGLREHTAHEALNQRWRTSLEATVGAIANTVEMRDPYTAGHQQRAARLAVAIARELGRPAYEIEGLYLAGIIHDVGKINIPAEILNKPGKLSSLEFSIIKEHAAAGFEIIKGVDFPWPIAETIRQHHERLDGSGYPQGLKGEAILPQARILAVADVVEAMMSHRPYRPTRGIDAALAEVRAGEGRIYDPAAVGACLALFRDKRFAFE